MAVQHIRMGQIWRNNTSGEDYLVTRVYSEALSSYAVLRKVGLDVGATQRVKVQKVSDGVTLDGYTFTQEEQKV
ncbi:MAG: hypothetical protein ACE5MH_03870 [Terriglobia bacterium]